MSMLSGLFCFLALASPVAAWSCVPGARAVRGARGGLAAGQLRMSAASAATGGRRKGTTKRDHMLEQMLESVDYTRSKAPPQVALAEDPMLPVVKTIALAADKRKAGSISAFRVSHMTEITTFMIVVEGNSRPQNQAIALAVEVCLLSPPLFLHSSRPVPSRPVSSRLESAWARFFNLASWARLIHMAPPHPPPPLPPPRTRRRTSWWITPCSHQRRVTLPVAGFC